MSNQTAAQQQLTDHLDALIEQGANLEDILTELERLGVVEDAPTDELGRVRVEDTTSQGRGYFNLRDRAGGDPAQARALAEWALRKIKAYHLQVADTNAAAAMQVEQVERWRSGIVAKAEREIGFFEGLLDQYHADFAPEEKTVKLVGGKLKVTKQRDTIQWDEPLAREWAMQQPDVDDLAPRSLSKSAVKSRLTKTDDGTYALAETGETVDFVRDVPPALAVKFSVELD